MKEADRPITLPQNLARHFGEIGRSFQKALEPFVAQMQSLQAVLMNAVRPLPTFKFNVRPDLEDIADLTFRNRTHEERGTASYRLARRVTASLRDPGAWEALREMARRKGKKPEALLREWLLPEGFILAADEIDRPQTIRLGKDWIVGPDGKIAELRPTELLFYEFAQWLYQEARNACEAIILDKTYPRASKGPLEMLGQVTDSGKFLNPGGKLPQADSQGKLGQKQIFNEEEMITMAARKNPGLIVGLLDLDDNPPLDKLLAREMSKEARARISGLMKKVSRKERQFLTLMLEGENNELQELLRKEGYSLSYIRQIRMRLRKKLSNL